MIRKEYVPNTLTYSRVLAVPVALGFMMVPAGAWPLLVIFVAASITDFLDGYLARKWNCTSALGAMLDPIADKLLVALMLLYLVTRSDVPLLPVAVIILREIYMAGLREFLAMRNIPLPVSKGGKWKTAVQMVAIIILLASLALHAAALWQPAVWMLLLAALLSLLSAIQYTRKAWPHLRAA